jgi:hypothetical protein
MPHPSPDEGWERRFVADAARARDALALYASAGFEVRAEPAEPQDFDAGCDSCALAKSGVFQVIYTRRATRAARSEP